MTYSTTENSVYSGIPVELYRFAYGSTVYRYTSADETVAYDGYDYTPEVVSRGQIEQNNEEQAGSLEVTLPRKNAVALLFLHYLPPSPVSLTLYRVHRSDLAAGVTAFVGSVSAVQFSGSEAKLTCIPISEVFRRPVPWEMFQNQCNHPLYSTACGVSKDMFKITGTVTYNTALALKATAFASYTDKYFNNGWVEDTDGAVRWIVNHAGDTLTLASHFDGVAVGDTVYAYAGCDRTEAVCLAKFSNLENFGGWAHIPEKNPFETSIT